MKAADVLAAVPQPSECKDLEEWHDEGEAMLRIANAIAQALPNVKSEHWRRALTTLARGLAEAAQYRAGRRPPSLGVAGSGR